MTPKMLAGLIRRGAKFRPQGTRVFCSEGKTCAIGAAAHALNPHLTIDSEISAAANTLANKFCWSDGPFDIRDIFEMNDSGKTREQIADWLETLDVSKPKDAQSFNDFMKVVTQPVELEAA